MRIPKIHPAASFGLGRFGGGRNLPAGFPWGDGEPRALGPVTDPRVPEPEGPQIGKRDSVYLAPGVWEKHKWLQQIGPKISRKK